MFILHAGLMIRVTMAVFMALLALGMAAWPGPGGAFRREQERFPRVRAARAQAQPRLETLFQAVGLTYPAREIFLRAFKMEGRLELWARNDGAAPFTLVKIYNICSASGILGPKRRQGDLQVPEGFYHVSGFNPWSRFHLSLRIDYPNASDRILGGAGDLGGDIFIHGSCVTIGCLPIEDGPIQEVYLAAVDARDAGQARIPVHIFPCRFGNGWRLLERQAGIRPELLDFWRNLKAGYDFFEKEHRLPGIVVKGDGRYAFQ